MLYDTHYQKLHPLLKYQYFFSLTSGPSHNCHDPYFLEMAHDFWKPGAIGPYACSAFPISDFHQILRLNYGLISCIRPQQSL